MPRSIITKALVIACTTLPGPLSAQFRNTYIHTMSDDHTAMEKSILGLHYIQVSTTLGATKDIHLVKLDASGNVVLDKIFFSPTGDEVALDICRGNGHSYVICGYETLGALDLGFVLRVDTNFNFINKVNIQVQSLNRHTPALNIINSAFYETPSGSPPYFPPDPNGGYLVTGFEAVGYAPTDAKSGYALKLTNALAFQWVAKYDSPIPAGTPDWDMCSHGTYMWAGAQGYFVGGSGSSPTGEQVALAGELNLGGTALWTKRYSDTTTPGSSTVAVDAAFDDAPLELYQLTNHSSSQGGGFITFEQGTGIIDPFLCSRFLANSPQYFVYEFGATCNSAILIISGYGHNQTAGTISGLFPFSFRYDKGTNPLPFPSPPAVDPSFSKYAYPVQSVGYSPNTTIFDKYTTGTHSRIYHPKMFAQLGVNEVTLAAFEDVGTDEENHIVHPYFSGVDSCSYIDPGFARVPIPLTEWNGPVPQAPTYVITPGTYASSTQTPNTQQCQNCTVDLTYTTTVGPNCTWTLTANNPGFCPFFTITDIANTVLFSGPGASVNFTFPLTGTYTICYADCGLGTNGVVCREESCTTIQVNCPPPCPLDADFNFTVSGCCVNFNDLTPEGNPNGCERWVFGNVATVNAGDVTSFCFPGPGTYTVCHIDCCMGSNGTMTYHQVCKQVTVNCAPPCCLPTGINVSVNNCCITATANLPVGCTAPTKWVWSFGDGNLSFNQTATHCYKGSGYYAVCLTAICSKTQKVKFCKTVKVLCAVPPPPPNGGSGTAKFSFSSSGTSISLTPAPAPPGMAVNARTWSFGDGQTSTATAPFHYYPLSGTYDIVHTVEGTDLGTGVPFIETDTVPVTLVLAPSCGCVPPPVGGHAATSLTCAANDPVLLRLIDLESESDIEHQWMVSTCGSSGCPTADFAPVPGAVGQHVWVDNTGGTAYYRCRSTSPLGFVRWSEEVEVTQGGFTVQISGPAGPVCPADSVPLVATGAVDYAWSNGATGSSVLTRPPVTTTYSVDGTNTAGCMDGAEVTVTVDGTGCAADVQVRVLLEGPMDVGIGLMNDALRAAGLVPLVEPYTALGYAWPAGSGGSSTAALVLSVTGNDAVVDWVLVELRDPAQPEVVLAARSALLQRDGDIVDVDGTSALRFAVGEGGYQVAVLHRNHLGVMTASPATLGWTSAGVDLTSAGVPTFGTNARKTVGTAPAFLVLWAGDVTFNSQVKYTGGGNDRDPILQAIGGTVPTATVTGQYRREDVNMNGQVKYTGSANDRDIILQNIGGTVPTATRNAQVP
ncbi:MAG: hypothetical protein IPJ87_17950 [Flavobacteriales bacterium]|nr:hypothetical protein [Flavobacteriales bacterium]MBK9699590.1 hypothetical protein [Flavobacteriales bacterium]